MFEDLKTINLLNLSQTIAANLFEKVIYPWEILLNIKSFIILTGNNLLKTEYNQVKENVWISKSAKISDSAHIDGPTIIDKETEIRHCAFVRGGAIIGKNCVVGNSVEIKNSILFNSVQVPHFNYVGDSILGYRAHLGAGVIISNLKSDKTEVKISFNSQKIDSKLKKFGAVVGDNSEIGCNTVLNPGTILGRNAMIYPQSMIRGYIPENCIFKKSGNIVQKSNNNV